MLFTKKWTTVITFECFSIKRCLKKDHCSSRFRTNALGIIQVVLRSDFDTCDSDIHDTFFVASLQQRNLLNRGVCMYVCLRVCMSVW